MFLCVCCCNKTPDQVVAVQACAVLYKPCVQKKRSRLRERWGAGGCGGAASHAPVDGGFPRTDASNMPGKTDFEYWPSC